MDSLPSSGGTLYFPAGNYSASFRMVGQDNVHFISDGGAVFQGGVGRIIGCEEADTYKVFSELVAGGNAAAVACASTNRIKNLYFKNIIFDGGNSAEYVIDFSAARDILFDNVTFRNFVVSDYPHAGIVNGNAVLNNIWFRNTNFEGKERVPIYLDGCHGCGVIDSTIQNNNFPAGSLLYLTNDDFSRDYDKNGNFDLYEMRQAAYIAIINNTFNGGGQGLGITGRNVIVSDNIWNGNYGELLWLDSKPSHVDERVKYEYVDIVVKRNQIDQVNRFLYLNNTTDYACSGWPTNCAVMGNYKVTDNAIRSVGQVVAKSGIIIGPEIVQNNCIGPNCSLPPKTSTSPQPTPQPSPTASVSTGSSEFPIGMFEDGNMIFGEVPAFTSMIDNLQSKGMNAVMFGNNTASRDEPMLSVSDSKNFSVYFGSHAETDNYFSDPTPTLQEARNIIYPIVDLVKGHSSIKGYNVADEPKLSDLDRVKNLVQAYKERDPSRPNSPVLIALGTGNQIFDASQPTMFIMDVYPFSVQSSQCDFTMKGLGYTDKDMPQYIRELSATKGNVPLYIILQAHKAGDSTWGINQLREPTVAEMRGQHWIAIGEGAHGIFWFIYETQQDWIGLKDNPTLMNEVSALAQRTNPLKTTLLTTRRNSTNLFTASNGAYVSTLTDGTKNYAVVANIGNCGGNQNITINSTQNGQLKDLETGQTYNLGSQLSFRPGDGKIFELVNSTGSTSTPAPSSAPGNLTVDFNSLNTGALTGVYPTNSGISWGSAFIVNPPAGPIATKSISFATGSTTSGTINLNPSRILSSFKVYPEGSGTTTFTVACPGNAAKESTVNRGQVTTVLTGWTNACSSITLSSGLAWEMSFDDFVFGNSKTGDLNNDSKTNVLDLSILLANWNKTGTNVADLNNDSKVNVLDLSVMLSNWG